MQKNIVLNSSRSPVYEEGTLYDPGKFMRAIDAASVQVRWRFDSECLPPFHELQPPVVDDGIVYIPSTCRYLYAVDANSGQVIWRYETPEGMEVRSFTVFKGLGYLVSEDARLHTIDLVTGMELGQAQFKPALMPLEVGPGIVAYNNLLLLQLGDRLLFAFR